MEMKHLFGLFVITVFLIACSGDSETGNIVEDITNNVEKVKALESQVESLLTQLKEREGTAAEANTSELCGVQEKMIESLETDLAAQIKVNKQQRQVMIDLDDECSEARAMQDSWDEVVEDLEGKNKKLQDMLDICQEDLS